MDPWRRFETKISTKEREGEKTLSTRPSPPPDDSFSNGFLTHRIPSRDNVHDSSRASCVHKGKVAGIDRLFPRPLPPSCKYNFNLGGNLERRARGCGRECTGAEWESKFPFSTPDFPTPCPLEIPGTVSRGFQGLKTQYLNYSSSFEMDARLCLSR